MYNPIVRIHVADDGTTTTITPEADHYFWVLINWDGSYLRTIWRDDVNYIDIADYAPGPGKYLLSGGIITNGNIDWFEGEWPVVIVPRVGPAVEVNVIDETNATIRITPEGADLYFWVLMDLDGIYLMSRPSFNDVITLTDYDIVPGRYWVSAVAVNNGVIEWANDWEQVTIPESPGTEPLVTATVSATNVTISPNNADSYYWVLIDPNTFNIADQGSHTTNVINIADHVSSDLPTGYYLLTVVATIDGAHVWAEDWVWIRLTGAGADMILEEIVDVEISVETAMILASVPREPNSRWWC